MALNVVRGRGVRGSGLAAIREAIKQFQTAAARGRAQAVAVYYAGHGVQMNGENYLVPVDADIKEAKHISSLTLPLKELVVALENTPAPVKIVVLDCCRNDPLGGRIRHSSVGIGLAALARTAEDFVVVFSTAPGHTSLDGDQKNSPFAIAFSAALHQPGLTLEDTFMFATLRVIEATKGMQQPWMSYNYFGDFRFLPTSS